MKTKKIASAVLAAVVALTCLGTGATAMAGTETAAQAGEKTGVEGQFVRVAENEEGWVVVGYRTANGSVKQDWMLLDVGMTVQKGVDPQKIERGDIALVTPRDEVVPLASQKEYLDASGMLRAMNERADMTHDSINYFPVGTDTPCRIGFFADTAEPMAGLSFDSVSLNDQRACVGRLFFKVPGGIEYGNYNLDVKFADSTVRVPIKIMTKEEAKAFEKEWKEAEKEDKH